MRALVLLFLCCHAVDVAIHNHAKYVKALPKRVRPLTFPLKKSSVPEEQRSVALLALQLRQRRPVESDDEDEVLLQTGSIPLQKEVLREKKIVTYYCQLQVGQQEFRILLDTGSCEFWIPSSDCTTRRCMRHRRYEIPDEADVTSLAFANPLLAPRFRVFSRAEMDIEYLSGKVQGPFVYETVRLGDVEVTDQLVGIASRVDIVLLDDVQWDGILGLAYPTQKLLTQGVQPFFDSIISKGLLTSRGLANQFAYYIDDDQGAISLGGADCDIIDPGGDVEDCASMFHFVPVVDKSYWTIRFTDIQVRWPNGREITGLCPLSGCKAIVDTGTYLMYGPSDIVSRVIGPLRSCSEYKDMPDIVLVVDAGQGQVVTLRLRPVDYVLKFAMDKRDDCVVGISPDKDTMWTLGQVFLRSFYTLFDRDKDRIGFAPLNRRAFTSLHENARVPMSLLP